MLELLKVYFYNFKLNEFLRNSSKEQLESYKRLIQSLDSLDKVNSKILGSISYCLDDNNLQISDVKIR